MKNRIILALTFILLIEASALAADKSYFNLGGNKRSLSNVTDEVAAGYYDHQFLSAKDPDLTEGNIKNGVTIFGKTGTLTATVIYSVGVPKTGQQPGLPSGAPFMAGDDCSYSDPAGDDIGYPRLTGSWNDCNDKRFTDSGGIVTDNATGLEWVQNPYGTVIEGTFTWANAVAACEALDYASHTDWRLPNIKELISIVDYGRYTSSTCIDKNHFPNIGNQSYWSSTSSSSTTTSAMYVDFTSGLIQRSDKTDPNLYIVAVRGGK